MCKQYIITEVAARPGFFCVHDFMLNNGGPPVIQSDFLKCHIIAPHSCPSPEAGATLGNPQRELIGRDVLGKASLHSESAYRCICLSLPYPNYRSPKPPSKTQSLAVPYDFQANH